MLTHQSYHYKEALKIRNTARLAIYKAVFPFGASTFWFSGLDIPTEEFM
jgi:hypothetical protein